MQSQTQQQQKVDDSKQNDLNKSKGNNATTAVAATTTNTTTSTSTTSNNKGKPNKTALEQSKSQSELLKSINQTLKAAVQKQQQLQTIHVPQFYFPNGKPEDRKDDQEIFKLANAEFNTHKEGKVYKENFENVVKAIGLPKYWKILLFRACIGNSKLEYVTYSMFEQLWKK